MRPDKILVTGACGQLGAVLTQKLREKYGFDNVVATDLKECKAVQGNFQILDVTDANKLKEIVVHNNITQIYHLAAILSANGEMNPLKTWDINMTTFFNVLEVSRLTNVDKVFFPSSIAVYGPDAPKLNTPQHHGLRPTTVYGMSKVSGENWANYYFEKYGLDVRSIRYPGVIGHQSLPGGGTTDYAVDIYHKAIVGEDFECFLSSETVLPMIYMDDAIRATIELMEAPKENISVRTSYNLSGMSFSPAELTKAIRKIYPNFKTIYNPDFRQQIADTWPSNIDDSWAWYDWKWKPAYDINAMTISMIKELEKKKLPELQNI